MASQFPPSVYAQYAETHKDALQYPQEDRFFLEPYLPVSGSFQQFIPEDDSPYPWTTLTYAVSLDSSIALSPGKQTVLSGPQSKAMTHYLRARHDGILVGVGTALADDPSLNCKLLGVGGYGGHKTNRQPRPIVVDPHGKMLDVLEKSKVIKLAKEGKGLGLWIVMRRIDGPNVLGRVRQLNDLLKEVDGKVVLVDTDHPRTDSKLKWTQILRRLKDEGLDSVMIEGGGNVINDLLKPEHHGLISSVIVTIAPTWLGRGGAVASPERSGGETGGEFVARLKDTKWHQLGGDVVLAGRVR